MNMDYSNYGEGFLYPAAQGPRWTVYPQARTGSHGWSWLYSPQLVTMTLTTLTSALACVSTATAGIRLVILNEQDPR
jgi:hypothetical protein